jgi:hypothetical protein
MNRSPVRFAAATGLAAVALLVAGCGSSTNTASSHHATRASGSAAQASVAQYIKAVTALQDPIQPAASSFFHAPTATATRSRAGRKLQQAYATAAHGLSAMTPPTVAAAAQGRLVKVWSSVGASLAKVLDHQPFRYAKAWKIAAAAEQPTASAYNDILTLP